MKSLKFKKIKILSDKDKKAIQFEFADRFNLILGKEKNSVGKSTVVKNIFWCLGCDPRFDSKWKELDCKALLEFEVNGVAYWVGRHGERMYFSTDGLEYTVFSNISGDFAIKIAEIVNFNALLPKRNEEFLVKPPPAFYFLPFYIDQKISWSSAWNSFDHLQQFANWQKAIISYHVGVTTKEYFDLTEDIYHKKQHQKEVKGELERVDIAISVVNEFVPDIATTVDVDELDELKKELKEDMVVLHEEQEVLFEELASLRSDKAYSKSQLEIANEAVEDLNADYEYALSVDDELLCPTCGTIHDNSLVSRFSLLEDKDQAEQVVIRLESDMKKIDKEINIKEKELNVLRNKIQSLNEKYYREEKNSTVTLQNILDGVAAHSVKRRVESHRKQNAEKLYDLESEEKKIVKERGNSIKENRKEIKEKFQALYPAFTSKLGAFGVNSSSIKSPENYGQVAKSGGAAEGSRAMLAYYLAVYNLIDLFSEEVLSPLVVDTPNQHEQAAKHYNSIVALIKDYTPIHSQIFLCGMDSPKLDPLKNEGRVFNLIFEHSLLDPSVYQTVKKNIGWIFETIPDSE